MKSIICIYIVIRLCMYIYTLYLGSEFTITVTFTTESKKFHPFLEVEI